MKKQAIWVMVLFFALVVAGCASKEQRPQQSAEVFAKITDDLGREVTLAKKPERIVVTSAGFIEPLHAVGGNIVGRPDAKLGVPDYAKEIPSIGRVFNVDMEKVFAVSPDLVLVNASINKKLIQPFESAGIPIIATDLKNYEDVKRGVRRFAEITGEKEKGEILVAKMEERIENVKRVLPKKALRVLILHGTGQGVTVQLDTSIAGSVAKMLGFTNVAAAMKSLENNPDAAPYSIETVVEQNPDVIFITTMGKIDDIKASMEKMMESNPAWQSIPAVRDKRLYYLSQEHFLLSPGIHYPEAVEEMAKRIYPEVFP